MTTFDLTTQGDALTTPPSDRTTPPSSRTMALSDRTTPPSDRTMALSERTTPPSDRTTQTFSPAVMTFRVTMATDSFTSVVSRADPLNLSCSAGELY